MNDTSTIDRQVAGEQATLARYQRLVERGDRADAMDLMRASEARLADLLAKQKTAHARRAPQRKIRRMR